MNENRSERATKTEAEWKLHFITKLKELHDDYTDEIPQEIMHGGDNVDDFKKYKVRGNWFTAVKHNLENAALKKFFPEDFVKEFTSFFNAYQNRMSSGKDVRTTKEEIDTANNILIKAQEIISNSLNETALKTEKEWKEYFIKGIDKLLN